MLLLETLKSHLDSECTVIYREFSAICGTNIHAAAMLSKFVYWTEVIEKDPQRNGWFYKTADDLKRELGLGRRGYEKARNFLVEKGILQYRRGGVHGKMHWRVNVQQLLSIIYTEIKGAVLPANVLASQIDIDNTQIPLWIPLAEWNAYIQMWRDNGKKLSNKHKAKFIKKLASIHRKGIDLKIIIERSTIGGWFGFFMPDSEPAASAIRHTTVADRKALKVAQAIQQQQKIQNPSLSASKMPQSFHRTPTSDQARAGAMSRIMGALKRKW